MNTNLTPVMTQFYPVFIDTQSYIGGQVLMLTTARFILPGKKKPQEIWRRANIIDIRLNSESPTHLIVEVERVSILRGGIYKADPTYDTTLHVRADSLSKTRAYSMLIETYEGSMKLVHCFCEPGRGINLPDEE